MADELEEQGRLGLTRTYIQHGSVTVYDHVCAVARTSLAMADALARIGIRVDRQSLLRGALLHDYFLYDWHDKDPSHRLHGFRHPFFALARAEEDFDLTPRERNIIVRHMFPLVPIPPTCREAWIVCIADKVCALRETVLMRRGRHGSEPACGASADSAPADGASSASASVSVSNDSSLSMDIAVPVPNASSTATDPVPDGSASAATAPASAFRVQASEALHA